MRKPRAWTCTPRMRDAHFRAALLDANAPIVQRRSGKARLWTGSSSGPFLPFHTSDFAAAGSDPTDILASGKLMGRAIAEDLPDNARLELARTFSAAVIRRYWEEIQAQFRAVWALPEGYATPGGSALEEPAASLAGALGAAAAQLSSVQASYLIGVIYTAMLPDQMRSRLGVYYTPPGLTKRLLDMAERAGVDWNKCRVLDPACGGGAFLAPVAARILSENRSLSARQLVNAIAERVRGFEIDPFSAWCSQVFLEATAMEVCREAKQRIPPVVEICNSLLRPPGEPVFDLVVGNPPYGRVTLDAQTRLRYQRSLYGHANLYSLFTDLAVQLTKPGGVIAYVTPTSFLAGEYFKALRKVLATQAVADNLDFVSVREGVFDDVLQETLLATYKRLDRRAGRAEGTVNVIVPTTYDEVKVVRAGSFAPPLRTDHPWLVPRNKNQQSLIACLRKMSHRLRDYGYQVSTGPLVWNRHKPQLSSRPAKGALPLIWAECVTPEGRFVYRADKKNHQPYFIPKEGDEWLITRKPCVLLQRTTAKEQARRLIAAELPSEFVAARGAVVIENHLNMVRPIGATPAVPLAVLAAFLNSAVLDRAFRCISGSVAVSAYELEALPLPPPERLSQVTNLVSSAPRTTEFEDACSALFEDEA